MYRRHARDVAILDFLSSQPRHHFEVAASDRRHLSRLWLDGHIRLCLGDFWEITERGLAVLHESAALH
jgi:hypothetical protein